LPAATRIVIVDRDGEQAHAVAGALLAQLGPSGRTARVLQGGTARYYAEIELGSSVSGQLPAVPSGSAQGPDRRPARAPAAEPPVKPTRKIRRAGC
jgi:hypothetical protein